MGVGTASGGGVGELTGEGSGIPAALSPQSPSAQQQAPQQKSMDLLADIFGGGAETAAPPMQPASPAPQNALMDLLGGDTTNTSNTSLPASGGSPSPVAATATATSVAAAASQSPQMQSNQNRYQAYSKNGLTIHFMPSRDRNNPAIINLQTIFSNDGMGPISSLQFQAAVPRSQKLQMAPASSTTVQPNATEKQLMRINNPQQVKLDREFAESKCSRSFFRRLSSCDCVLLTLLTARKWTM